MKILHTSDWHLGRTFHGRKRHGETQAFLDWLGEHILEERIDALLIVGDVFDGVAPPNAAQEQYYRFLCDVARSPCRHVVITAGNHDSPYFLEAPRELLRMLNIHVVSRTAESAASEILVLDDANGAPSLVVCAVPCLRDRDIRTAAAGETVSDRAEKLRRGIAEHYRAVIALARRRCRELSTGQPALPLVVMGHLYTSGALTADTERPVYVGTLADVSPEIFSPGEVDYVALGHLHLPQFVGKKGKVRYSGAPLPMDFSEAGSPKSIDIVSLENGETSIRSVPVPSFQRIERLRGGWDALSFALAGLVASNESVWVEVLYEGTDLVGNLREHVLSLTEGTSVEPIKIVDRRASRRTLSPAATGEALEDLDVFDVFERRLAAAEYQEETAAWLRTAYAEIVSSLDTDDDAPSANAS